MVSPTGYTERLNIQFVSAQSRTGLLTAQEAQHVWQLHEENRQFLRIPRRWVLQGWAKATLCGRLSCRPGNGALFHRYSEVIADLHEPAVSGSAAACRCCQCQHVCSDWLCLQLKAWH